ERVPGFVTEIHHDLARVLEIVHRALEPGELRIGEIERNADHRLAVGTAPLVGEIAQRTKALESLALELAVELKHVALDRRAFELEPKLADALAEKIPDVRGSAFEPNHAPMLRSGPRGDKGAGPVAAPRGRRRSWRVARASVVRPVKNWQRLTD